MASFTQPVINQNTMNEIKRKALNNEALLQSTPEKDALYNMYKVQNMPKPQQSDMNTSIASMQNDSNGFINNMYDQQKESQLAGLRAQRDKAVGNINFQKTQVAPQYQNMRNQSDVQNQQSAQKLREIMAANGLNATGENVSATASMNNERVNSLNKLNLQERETMNNFDRQITDLMNPADENALIASLEAQRSQAQYDAFNRANDVGYQRYRDQVGDSRYDNEQAYNRGRDAIGDNRYNDETQYNRGRDSESDKRYYDERTYDRGRDKVADQRYGDETQYNRGQDAQAEAWRQKEWNQMSPSQKQQMEADFNDWVRRQNYDGGSNVGGRRSSGGTRTSRSGASTPAGTTSQPQTLEEAYANYLRDQQTKKQYAPDQFNPTQSRPRPIY